MKLASRVRMLVTSLIQRRKMESEMTDEQQFHIEERAADLVNRQSLSRARALRQARIEFGSIERYKEEGRQARGVQLLDELRGDIRYGVRQLRRSPVFTIVAILTLAIGIGTNTAMFTLINAVMLKKLPVPQPEQLRQISWTATRDGFAHSYRGGGVLLDAAGNRAKESFAYPIFQYLSTHTRSFSDVFCWMFPNVSLNVAGRTETVRAQFVFANYFRGLGISPVLGRAIGPEDTQPGAPPVVVISYGFWQRALGGESKAVGQTILVNGTNVVIIGVLPPEFYGIDPASRTDVILTMSAENSALSDPHAWQFQVFGRLRPGVSDEQARAETETLVRQAILAAPQERPYDLPRLWLTDSSRGLQGLQRYVSTPLLIIGSGAGLILLIACSNLAGMLLARAAIRKREIAARLALGARRARVIRQLLSESLLLSVFGGAAGTVLLYVLPGWLLAGLRRGYRDSAVELAPDLQVLVVSILLSTITAIAFGLLPAMRATRVDLVSMLKHTSDSTPGRSPFALAKLLVTLQVALSLILLVASGLFIRTVVNLNSQPKGFRAQGVLTFQLSPGRAGYRDGRLLDLYRQAVARLESVPGVSSASLSLSGILTDTESGAHIRLAAAEAKTEAENTRLQAIGPRFFETMGTPMLAGRDYRWQDRNEAASPVIVNETLARRLFAGKNPLGEKVILDVLGAGPPSEIIGIVADSKYNDLRDAPPATAYISFMHYNPSSMIFAVRSELAAAALSVGIRQAMRELDAKLAVDQLMTQQEYVDRKMSLEQMMTRVLTGFGVVALFLAALGIYGTLAYSVSQRSSEIGIRMALGAQRRTVVRSVVKQSLAPVIAGLLLGVCGAAAVNRLFNGLLFGITASDPLTVLTAAAILIVAALAATCIPARHASRIDPMRALRHE